MSDSRPPDISKSWDTYWRGTGDARAYSSGGANHPALAEFWNVLFLSFIAERRPVKLVDVATGNGAVVEHALAHLAHEGIDITCVDIATAAIDNIHARFPGVRGIVADAREIPLDDGGFDLATSQFGAEYAGVDAVYEVARLVAAGGTLAMLLHIADGSIQKECDDSLAAVGRLKDAGFVPRARRFFAAGFDAVRGGDRGSYDAAGLELAPAIREVESIIADFGEHVAGDTITRLYRDVGRIHEGIQSYDAQEVLDWLAAMERELDAYAGRMASMRESAIDRETFGEICENLRARGFDLTRAEPLLPAGADGPVAWTLVAQRRGAARNNS